MKTNKKIHWKPGSKLLPGVLLATGLFAQLGMARAQDGAVSKPAAQPKTIQFLNGQWFNGKSFAPTTFYSVNGLLTRHKHSVVTETVDLHHGYVVPPFGDAHCHYFDDPSDVEARTRTYLTDGIFYVKVLTNSLSGARAVADKVNIPTGVDVQYAHGGLTGNNSHPIPIYEGLALGFYNGKDMAAHKEQILKSRLRENDCYYIVDTASDLARKWPLILAGKPDFLKVYLTHSEDYQKRKAKQGYGEGLDPALLPAIIARAHQAGLRVSAHVDSAVDYHTALVAGVDEMAHLPGYYIEQGEEVKTYTLSDEDARLTARRGVSVVPTASVTDAMPDIAARATTRANQIRNLRLLKNAGVKFGVGADSYGEDALKEALHLSKMGVWNNLETLRMWCEDTPRCVFPKRRIGYLREGYEASFVVLDADPLANFDNVTKIALRCKQGNLLPTPPRPAQSSTPSPPKAAANTTSAKNVQFLNGQWFNGKSFASLTFYAVNGLLTRRRPVVVDAVVDLHNGYVVPPFGDAHCHHFDGASNIAQQIEMYLRDGIFYAKVLTNSLSGARAVADKVNIPTSVDVKYAHGGLTGSNSHPIPTYEGLGLGYYNSADMIAHKDEILHSRRRENDCYYIVDTSPDLARKWPLILVGRPDFIKVYLLNSEHYEKRRKEQGYGEGIDPQLLPQIVSRAHKAGLRVSAHVDSAADYRNALAAGVDEMAHMPGYYIKPDEDARAYILSIEDIALTARRGVNVVPTANLADDTTGGERDRTRSVQIHNLKLLKEAGVKFGIGTDSYGTDALKEALYLSKLGVWNNLEMLRMWCEDTPRHLFPKRKIGCLREGYEASFVVLAADPLTRFDNVTKIALRCKQGDVLKIVASSPAK